MKYRIKGTGRHNRFGESEFMVQGKFLGIWWPPMTWVWEKTLYDALQSAKKVVALKSGGPTESVEFDV